MGEIIDMQQYRIKKDLEKQMIEVPPKFIKQMALDSAMNRHPSGKGRDV